jgi:predicted XRE-type DNA-binding protein
MKSKRDFSVSTGNVFADLDVSAPDEALAKAELAAEVARIISSRRLTQAAAAKVLRIDQPKVSALLRGRISGFSTERLLKFLRMLGSDVDIVIRARNHARRVGHLHVVSA